MSFSVRIVIVEDEVLIRSMLRLFCEREESWHVVGEAGDCIEACSIVEAMRPDIVLLDLTLGGESGLDCLPQLIRLGAKRVLVLTGTEETSVHVQALTSGASVVLRKGDPAEKILSAIREQAASIAADRVRSAISAPQVVSESISSSFNRTNILDLTQRELRIIKLVADGRQDDDIAAELDISLSALHHNLSAIYHKLNVPDRVALVVYAFRHHLAGPMPREEVAE